MHIGPHNDFPVKRKKLIAGKRDSRSTVLGFGLDSQSGPKEERSLVGYTRVITGLLRVFPLTPTSFTSYTHL